MREGYRKRKREGGERGSEGRIEERGGGEKEGSISCILNH